MKRSVCIIPARGGSKGIPNKNIVALAGKPMVAWSIEQALKSKSIGKHVFVTSDSDEILEVAKSYGAQGIKRPANISNDTASSESAISHAYFEAKIILAVKNIEIEFIVFLQPTSPLRMPDDIENAIQKIKREKSDSLLSVQPLRDYFIWEQQADSFVSKNFDFKHRKRRQDIEPTYLENGSIYIFKPEILLNENNRLGGKISVYEMDKIHSQQIDDRDDIELCEYFLKKHYS